MESYTRKCERMKSNNLNNDQDFCKAPELNENQVLRNPRIDLLDESSNSSSSINYKVLKDVKTDLDDEIEECLKIFEIESESSKSDVGSSENNDIISNQKCTEESNMKCNTKGTFVIETNKDRPIINIVKDKGSKFIKEFEDWISSDSEVESINVENRQPSNFFEGDTLILQCEESDIDSELEKCYELLNANEHQETTAVYKEINLDNKIGVTEHLISKTSECISDNLNVNNLNFNLNNEGNKLEINKVTTNGSNILKENVYLEQNTPSNNDSWLIIHEESDIDSEIEKCDELIFPSNADSENKLKKGCQKHINSLAIKPIKNQFDNIETILEQEVNLQNNSSGNKETNINTKYNEEINFKDNNIETNSNFTTNEKVNFEYNYKSNSSEKNSDIPGKGKFHLNDNFKSNNDVIDKVDFNDNCISSREKISTFNFTMDENKVYFKSNNEKNSNVSHSDNNNGLVFKDNSKCNSERDYDTKVISNEKLRLNRKSPNSKVVLRNNIKDTDIINATNEDIEFKDNSKNNSKRNCDSVLTKEESKSNKKSPNSKITPDKNSPERIFKLAIGSLNSVPNNNKNANLKEVTEKDLKLNEPQKEQHNQVKDYLEDEKDDIINPEWQAVKNLCTNEERYRQVRNCWMSKTVPDPNKNLTYHSYRKRLFTSGKVEVQPIRQHKRHASSDLNKGNAKRPCTFFLDKEIDSIRQTKYKKKQAIITEMHDKISIVDEQCFQRQNQMQAGYHNSNRYNKYYDRNEQLYPLFNNRVSVIANEYNKIVDCCEYTFEDQIGTLNEKRNEVLKFYSFYKGLNDSKDDPTLLTESQFQELDEIENVYRQFNHYYK